MAFNPRIKQLVLAMETQQEESEWIGFDLDGTVAFYDHWRGADHIGAPIEKTITKIKSLLDQGTRVKIFTARVGGRVASENEKARQLIEAYCEEHIGQALEVTNQKDPMMKCLYDDRCKQVIPNTGIVV